MEMESLDISTAFLQGHTIVVYDADAANIIILGLKALNGLVDEPMPLQQALLQFMKWEIGFQMSLYKDNLLIASFSPKFLELSSNFLTWKAGKIYFYCHQNLYLE